MKVQFHKYEGAGNDFVIFDSRKGDLKLSPESIERLCNRRFGIGADGLMLLENCPNADFRMIYYNADGNESSFCGNGGRCIADYAATVLKIAGNTLDFEASDGHHRAELQAEGRVALSMRPVQKIEFLDDHVLLDTGSPHFVKFVKGLDQYPVFAEGREIRNRPAFQPKGINVNFVEVKEGKNYIRTYERGVEAETFACGTGITAAAIALAGVAIGNFSVPLIAKAGHYFEVAFNKPDAASAKDIVLTGPVKMVFEGTVVLA